MSHQYTNPPLLEALCELQFKENTPWDFTVPGLFYEKVKAEYGKKEQINKVGVSLEPDEEKNIRPQVKIDQLIQFSGETAPVILQLGQNLLVANVVKPYAGWDEFNSRISQALSFYKESANPKSIERLTLRYINQVSIPGATDIKDYLNIHISAPDDIAKLPESFKSQIRLLDERDEKNITLTIGSAENSDAANYSFLLDITYSLNKEVELSNFEEELVFAHAQIDRVFNLALTDNARKLFN